MFDAGVACNMMYTPNESSAYTNEMAAAMTTYFGYDKGITMFRRDDFTEADFTFFLKRELNAGRPVLFSGAGSGGGHCFVCDGYDENGYFHINWGWNGTSNGYFHVSNLNPSALGTGGGSGGYTRNVMFFGGIQPPRSNSQVPYALSFTTMSAPLRLGRGQTGKYVMQRLNNSSLYPFNGQCGVALYSGGKLRQVLGSANVSLKANYYFDNFTVNVTMPRNLANGSYQVVMVYKEQSDTKWRPCLSATCNCIDMNFSNQGTTGSFNNNVHYCDLPTMDSTEASTMMDEAVLSTKKKTMEEVSRIPLH